MALSRIVLAPVRPALYYVPAIARVPIARYATATPNATEKTGPQEAAAELAKQLAKHSSSSAAESPKVVLPSQASVPEGVSKPPLAYSPDSLPPRQDPLLQFFVNLLMREGKKARAERWVAEMLGHMAKLTNSSPVPLVHEAVRLARPLLRMQSRKQGGKTIQVPIPLNERQSTRRALVWIIEASDRRLDRMISRRLAVEVLAVLEGNSSVLTRRDELHKIGTNNRSNASVRI
ncbi:hypothetical protein MCUN1_000611 [Malassezia cuniculi]|uniref:Small ribosomal subunit protein uS7 domain-containing protein n=1 Tax=Malassezia cuniculi TaxID=948313 RepID=A0AAF0J4U1_9BASI|nr:hypothetical protein MCUN1_000611 [Malassezia cuniculi]